MHLETGLGFVSVASDTSLCDSAHLVSGLGRGRQRGMLACFDLELVGVWSCGLTPQFSGGACWCVFSCQGSSLGLLPASLLGAQSVPQCSASWWWVVPCVLGLPSVSGVG